MAAQTNRTITLTLNAQTNGSDSVRDLAAEIEKLGKKGGDAAPEFQALSKELNELANRKDTVQTFEELTTAVVASRTALDAAKTAAAAEQTTLTGLKQTLDAVRTAEDTYAATVRAATVAKTQTKQANLEAKASLDAFVASIGGAKRVTDDNREAYNALTQAVRGTKAEYTAASAALSKLNPEYEQLKKATNEASEAVKTQEREFNKVNTTVDAARTEYTQLTDALGQTSTKMSQLGLDTNDLAGENNKLVQSMARLQTEADQLKTALANPGKAALTASHQIEQAFGTVGVKSTKSLQAEINKVNNALIHLAQDASISGADFDRAFASGKGKVAALESELRKAENASKGFGSEFGNALKQFGPATLVFNGVSAAISAIFTAGQKIPQVTAEFQTMERTLRILTGSTAQAQKEMQYVADVSNRVGIGIKSTADSYIKLTAATKGTNLEGAQTRRIFEAVSGAMGALGASSSEAENAMSAVTQMVSKGVVSMEEMRQQLAERLPGAFQATAKELGITDAELTALISSGKLAASDMLPALAAGLEKVYKTGEQNDTLVGKWNNFINALKQSGAAIGESGLVDSLLTVGRVGTAAAAHLAEGFIYTGKVIGIFAAGAMRGDLSGALAEATKQAEEMNKRISDISGTTPKTAKSVQELALEAQKAGKEFFTLANGTEVSTKNALGASNAFIQFSVASGKAFDSAENFATSARKVAEYTRSAGEASITAANAIGDETDKRNTATTVAENNTKALINLVAKEREVIAVLEEEALVRAKNIASGEAATDTHKQQLIALGEDIEKRKVANEGLQRQADANRVLAEALKIETETLKDNSDRRAELTEINKEYIRVLEILRAAVAAGELSQSQLNVVEEDSRKNKRLLIDALQDQVEKTEALKNAKLSELDITSAGIRLAIEQQRTLIAVAKAKGDEYGATQGLLEIKRLEIKLAELTAQAKKAEADAAVLVAQTKREEAIATGTLTAAKEAELRAMEAGARVKQVEAQIASETASRLRQLADATYEAGAASTDAAGGYDRLAQSLGGVASAAKAADDSVKSLNSNDPYLPDGPIGHRGGYAAGVDNETAAYKMGYTAEEVSAAKSKIESELARILAQNPSTSTSPSAYLAAQQKATTLAIGKAPGGRLGGLSTSSVIDNALFEKSAKDLATSTTTVNINLAGKTTAVKVASAADASALTNLLKQLESEAGRSYG